MSQPTDLGSSKTTNRPLEFQRVIGGDALDFRGNFLRKIPNTRKSLKSKIYDSFLWDLMARYDFLASIQRIAQIGYWCWNRSASTFEYSDEVAGLFSLSGRITKIPYRKCLRFVHPEDRRFLIETFRTAGDARRPLECVFRCSRPDGELFIVHGKAEIEFDGRSEVKRIKGTIQDITGRCLSSKKLKGFCECERERTRIGEELHDDLKQRLVGVFHMCGAMRGKMADTSDDRVKYLDVILAQINQTMNRLDAIINDLYAIKLDGNDLLSALRQFVLDIQNMYTMPCHLKWMGENRNCDCNVATQMYWIVKESVINACKHSRAQNIWIDLNFKDRQLDIIVEDDGMGISDRSKNTSGNGLAIMKHRAATIGARVDIRKNSKGGTTVRVSADRSVRYPVDYAL